jgi:hypothetical protein
MPATIKAQRIQCCKEKFNRLHDEKGRHTAEEIAAAKGRRFQRQWGAIHEMLGIRTLSRVNQRWCKKAIVKMREEYPDAESHRMIGLLDDRVDRAAKRLQERDDERAAGRKPKKETAPATPPVAPGTSPVEIWKQMIKEQQEKKL